MDYSIIIPTHNRQRKLTRILTYLDQFPVSVIIIDSSNKISDFKRFKNVEYYHDQNLTFSQKVIHGCNVAKTNFVALCADDDFVIPEKIQQLLITCDESIVGIIGPVITFQETFDGKFKRQSNFSDDKIFTNKNAGEFFGNFSQVLWGVYKTTVICNAFAKLDTLKFENDNFIEIFLSYFLMSNGGLCRQNNFFNVREISNGDHWGKRHVSLRQECQSSSAVFISDYSKITSAFPNSNFTEAFDQYLNKPSKQPKSLFQKILTRFNKSKLLKIQKANNFYKAKELINIAKILRKE